MAVNVTRMLVLGAVRIFAPTNGYQLRRELLSWEIESWANIKPGSIYSMLSTLAKQGLVTATELNDGGRLVTVYSITDAGGEELIRLVGDGISTADAMNPASFRAASSLMTLLTRSAFIRFGRERIASLYQRRFGLGEWLAEVEQRRTLPPHVISSYELESLLLDSELAWFTDFLSGIEAGGLRFAGEPGDDWMPPPEDPGWPMARERERYLQALQGNSRS